MRRRKLVEARKAAGKSQEDVAEEVGVDRTTIGKWERGESTPYPGQRPTYAEALGITLTELASMLSSIPNDVGGMPDWLSTFLALEQSAVEMRVHEPRMVLGLLQAPAYTRAVVSLLGLTGASDAYVERSVERRRHRQKRIHDASLTLDVIQTEASLRLRVGDATAMAEQITALADLAELPNVTVRVTTFDAGQYEARRLDTFHIMAHQWGNPRVLVEEYSGGQFLTDADEVEYFAAAYEQATRIALSPSDSIAFIRELATDWTTKR